MDPNPFAALSLIVAPAILTNASSVLSMSTSNRLARAVDRARELSRQLEAAEGSGGPAGSEDAREFERRLNELTATEERAIMVHVSIHTAHHLGQVVLLRQLIGVWPPPSGSWTW